MKQIPLTKGFFAIVDDDDFEWLSQWHWALMAQGGKLYAYRSVKKNGIQRRIYMHRAILNAPEGLEVDHRDRNGLNNSKLNIRLCTHQENQRNLKRSVKNRSGYRGVSWDREKNKWFACIRANGKSRYLGRFDDVEKAAEAYNMAALKHFGEFASLNPL